MGAIVGVVGLTMKVGVPCSSMLLTELSGNVTMPVETAKNLRLSRRLLRDIVAGEWHLVFRMNPVARRVDERGCDKH